LVSNISHVAKLTSFPSWRGSIPERFIIPSIDLLLHHLVSSREGHRTAPTLKASSLPSFSFEEKVRAKSFFMSFYIQLLSSLVKDDHADLGYAQKSERDSG